MHNVNESAEVRLTVRLDLPTFGLNYPAQVWPFRQVLKVKADIVSFCERIEIASVEVEQVFGLHHTHRRHGCDEKFSLPGKTIIILMSAENNGYDEEQISNATSNANVRK